MGCIIKLLFTTYLLRVHSQRWVGTFVVTSTCNGTSCCCLSDQIVFMMPQAALLAFNGSLSGPCLGKTSFSDTINYSGGYKSTYTLESMSIAFTIMLSNDSNSLTITASSEQFCNVEAVRSNTSLENETDFDNTTQEAMTTITSTNVSSSTTPQITSTTTTSASVSVLRKHTNIIMVFTLVSFCVSAKNI